MFHQTNQAERAIDARLSQARATERLAAAAERIAPDWTQPPPDESILVAGQLKLIDPREVALEQAVIFHSRSGLPADEVVKTAEAFRVFLAGDDGVEVQS